MTEQSRDHIEAIADDHTSLPLRSNHGLGLAAAAIASLAATACGDDGNADGGSDDTSTGGPEPTTTTGVTTVDTTTSGSTGSSTTAVVDDTAGSSTTGPGEPDADVEPLNALLTAEYLAIAAYSAGAGLIGAAPAEDPLFGLAQVITDVAVSFQAQHRLHAEALVAAIEALGGEPVDEQTVADTFVPPQGLVDNPTITNVLKFAAGAERSAAVAYNQVVGSLESAQQRFLASAIEGDETQHFIVLAALVLGLADPGPNLDSDSADTVVPAAFVYTVGRENGLNDLPPDYFP